MPRRLIGIVPVSVVILAAGFAAPPAPQAAACADARHRDFDFWIGEWDVRTPDGRAAGRNVIERILNGCALQERWTGASGSRGVSINFWDAHDGRWHQVWIDDRGQPLRLSGNLEDGRMALEGVTPDSAGRPVRQRITWTRLADGRVRQHWESAAGEGRGWRTVFDGLYSRSRP